MNAIVNCYDELAPGEQWRFMVWNMKDVDSVSAKQSRNLPVVAQETVPLGLVQLFEIRR